MSTTSKNSTTKVQSVVSKSTKAIDLASVTINASAEQVKQENLDQMLNKGKYFETLKISDSAITDELEELATKGMFSFRKGNMAIVLSKVLENEFTEIEKESNGKKVIYILQPIIVDIYFNQVDEDFSNHTESEKLKDVKHILNLPISYLAGSRYAESKFVNSASLESINIAHNDQILKQFDIPEEKIKEYKDKKELQLLCVEYFKRESNDKRYVDFRLKVNFANEQYRLFLDKTVVATFDEYQYKSIKDLNISDTLDQM